MKTSVTGSLCISLLIMAFMVLSPFQATAKKEKLKLPAKSQTNKETSTKSRQDDSCLTIDRADSLRFPNLERGITFSGYDKQLAATKESFLITNSSEEEIMSLVIRIDYLATDGRQIHSRLVTVKENLPSGKTRKTDVKSWDSQKSFYYYKSRKPKQGGSSPYRVAMRLEEVSICRSSD